MHAIGAKKCMPTLREGDKKMRRLPWISGFTPGYIKRVGHIFPKQGSIEPWVNPQIYSKDVELLEKVPLDDGVLVFSNAAL